MMSLRVWLPGPMFLLGGLYLWSHVPSRGSLSGGLCQRDPQQRPPLPQTGRADGMHPTRMLSCLKLVCSNPNGLFRCNAKLNANIDL